jgi:hypothetical protein
MADLEEVAPAGRRVHAEIPVPLAVQPGEPPRHPVPVREHAGDEAGPESRAGVGERIRLAHGAELTAQSSRRRAHGAEAHGAERS